MKRNLDDHGVRDRRRHERLHSWDITGDDRRDCLHEITRDGSREFGHSLVTDGSPFIETASRNPIDHEGMMTLIEGRGLGEMISEW